MTKAADFVNDNDKPPETANFSKEADLTHAMESKEATCSAEPAVVSPTRKHMSVHWSDHYVVQPKQSYCATDCTSNKKARRNCQTDVCTTKCLSASPPKNSEVKLQELELQLKKKESRIIHACKLELYFLDNMKKVRAKRMQMVSELEEIRGQIRKLSKDAANRDHFILPPVPSDCDNGNSLHTLTASLHLQEDFSSHR
jgi:hypothetical protein